MMFSSPSNIKCQDIIFLITSYNYVKLWTPDLRWAITPDQGGIILWASVCCSLEPLNLGGLRASLFKEFAISLHQAM
jgi:hypothetical protein